MLKYGGPGDSSYWNQTTWPQAQKLNADIYTILLGTNDAKYAMMGQRVCLLVHTLAYWLRTFNWFPCNGAPFGFGNCSWVGGEAAQEKGTGPRMCRRLLSPHRAGDNYTADFLDMISILKAQPAKPRVFVMSPPPLCACLALLAVLADLCHTLPWSPRRPALPLLVRAAAAQCAAAAVVPTPPSSSSSSCPFPPIAA